MTPMPSPWRRALGEHRRLLIPLVLGLVVNVGVYAFVVYPLAQQVANVEQRTAGAEGALAAARTEHAQAAGALTGKDQATAELATFYRDVLPQDQSAARRSTYLRLAQLARQANLAYESSAYETSQERESTLTRLKITMELSGSYDEVRAFIHRIETIAEFVVIDNVTLTEGNDGGQLTIALELSTFYRAGA